MHLLLDGGDVGRWQLFRLIASACLCAWRDPQIDGHILLNTGHNGLEYPLHAQTFRRRGVRLVFVIHDLIPISHPEYFRPGEMLRHCARMNNAIALGQGIIAVSQDTLDKLVAHANGTGKKMPSAVVALLAPGLQPTDQGSRPMAEPYFVILGTIEPRKNHLLLLQIWRGMAENLGSAAPHLIVVGQRGWECENVVDILERCESLKSLVHERPSCSDKELLGILSHAQAVLFPSFIEGYGLPLVESLSVGVPAIVSDLAVFREFAGDIPEYVDALDGKQWLELIVDYAKPNSVKRATQMTKIRNFQAPTWPIHMAKVEAFLHTLSTDPSDAATQHPD